MKKLSPPPAKSEWPKLPKTFAAARASGSKWYYPGTPCKHGHVDIYSTSARQCRECRNTAKEGYRAADMKATGTEDYRDDWNAQCRAKYRKNPESYHARARDRARRGASGYWYVVTKMPPWLTDKERVELKAMYGASLPGEEVDHIVPKDDHPEIVGLHVPWNLQYLTRSQNLKRRRKQVNAFNPTPALIVQYVACGMAVWRRDVAPDGTIDWSKYRRPATVLIEYSSRLHATT